jgi:excisionase family DNA binding protein
MHASRPGVAGVPHTRRARPGARVALEALADQVDSGRRQVGDRHGRVTDVRRGLPPAGRPGGVTRPCRWSQHLYDAYRLIVTWVARDARLRDKLLGMQQLFQDAASEMLGTTEAGQELGVSAERVRMLITTHRLPARKIGRDWVIQRADLSAVAERPVGRPRRAGGDRARRSSGHASETRAS